MDAQVNTAELIRYRKIDWVKDATSLGRTSIYEAVRRGEFPKPRRLSRNRVGWVEAEVQAWLFAQAIGDAA